MENKHNEKEIKDKQIKISADRHRKLKVIAAQEDKEMRDIINEAFDLYVEKKKLSD